MPTPVTPWDGVSDERTAWLRSWVRAPGRRRGGRRRTPGRARPCVRPCMLPSSRDPRRARGHRHRRRARGVRPCRFCRDACTRRLRDHAGATDARVDGRAGPRDRPVAGRGGRGVPVRVLLVPGQGVPEGAARASDHHAINRRRHTGADVDRSVGSGLGPTRLRGYQRAPDRHVGLGVVEQWKCRRRTGRWRGTRGRGGLVGDTAARRGAGRGGKTDEPGLSNTNEEAPAVTLASTHRDRSGRPHPLDADDGLDGHHPLA